MCELGFERKQNYNNKIYLLVETSNQLLYMIKTFITKRINFSCLSSATEEQQKFLSIT